MKRLALCVLASFLLLLALPPGQASAPTTEVTELWDWQNPNRVSSLSTSADMSYLATGNAKGWIHFFSRSSRIPIWAKEIGHSVSISSDGSRIAVGASHWTTIYSGSGKVLLLSNDGSLLWAYETDDPVTSIVISADGSYIAASTSIHEMGAWSLLIKEYSKIHLFSHTSPVPLWSYMTDAPVLSMAISSDGSYITVGTGGRHAIGVDSYFYRTLEGYNGSVYLFSRIDNTLLWRYEVERIGHNLVFISSDGKRILSKIDSVVHLFSRSENIPVWSYWGDEYERVTSAAMSADGSAIAVGSEWGEELGVPSAYVRLFSPESGTPIWSYWIEGAEFSYEYGIRSIAVSGDGNYVIACDKGARWVNERLYLFSCSDNAPIWSQQTYGIDRLMMSSDGRYVVVMDYDLHRLHLYEVKVPTKGLGPTSISISPPSFTLAPNESVTLTATLTSDRTPLAGKTVTWDATDGSINPPSDTTDSQGKVTATYTAPSDEGSVTVTASFAGDLQYESSSGGVDGLITTQPAGEGSPRPTNWWPWLLLPVFLILAIGLAAYRKQKKPKRGRKAREPAGLHCPKCGAEIPQGAGFCPVCGAKLRRG